MKNKDPVLPIFVKDFISDTKVVVMSNAALGIYFRLLLHCWADGYLLKDNKTLKKLACAGREWYAYRTTVLARFYTTTHSVEGVRTPVYKHKRLEVERRKIRAFKRSRKQAAKTRWEKDDARA